MCRPCELPKSDEALNNLESDYTYNLEVYSVNDSHETIPESLMHVLLGVLVRISQFHPGAELNYHAFLRPLRHQPGPV